MVFSKWRLKDVLITTFIAIITGIVFYSFDLIYNLVYASLATTGWALIVGEAVDGLWCIAGPITFMITRLPGSAVFAETLGALIASLLGGTGFGGITEGLFQGLGFEIAFLVFKYKYFNFKVLALGAFLDTITSFIADLFVQSYLKLQVHVLIIYFLVRLVSMIVFTLLLVYLIWKIFQKTKILKT